MESSYKRTKELLKENNYKLLYGLKNRKNKEIDISEGFDICLVNEIVKRLLDEGHKVQELTQEMFAKELNAMEGNFNDGNARENDGIVKGIYNKWKENAYFEGTIPKAANVEKDFLYDLILTVETERTQDTYTTELTKIVKNFKKEVNNIFFSSSRNEKSVLDILEEINDDANKRNEFYNKIFDKVDFEKIFINNDEEKTQQRKNAFVLALVDSYKNMISKNVQEETINEEKKVSTMSQQFKEIVFLHNDHDVLCIAAHVNKNQIEGFKDVEVSYAECEDEHGVVRQYIYNYSDGELANLNIRRLAEDEEYSEIFRMGEAIRDDIEKEDDSKDKN